MVRVKRLSTDQYRSSYEESFQPLDCVVELLDSGVDQMSMRSPTCDGNNLSHGSTVQMKKPGTWLILRGVLSRYHCNALSDADIYCTDNGPGV